MNKKILAVLMALMMVLTSAVAFAAEDGTVENPYIDDATITITKNYENTTSWANPAENFIFTASDETITISPAQVSSSDKDQNVSFTITLPEYNTPGVHEYDITETASEFAGVSTIDGSLKLVVQVVQNAEQEGLTRVVYLKQGDAKTDTITGNKYEAGQLTLEKQVTGTMGDRAKEFTFKVVLNADKKIDATLLGGVNQENVSVSEDGKTVTISNIKLADDGTLTITNIPKDVSWKITEEEANQDGYETTPSNETGMMTANGDVKSTFTNHKDGDDIATGVFTDNMPYIMLMAFVMILAAAVVLKKRSVNE